MCAGPLLESTVPMLTGEGGEWPAVGVSGGSRYVTSMTWIGRRTIEYDGFLALATTGMSGYFGAMNGALAYTTRPPTMVSSDCVFAISLAGTVR